MSLLNPITFLAAMLFSLLGYFPIIFRPFLVVLIILSFVFIVFEIISSIWRLIGR